MSAGFSAESVLCRSTLRFHFPDTRPLIPCLSRPQKVRYCFFSPPSPSTLYHHTDLSLSFSHHQSHSRSASLYRVRDIRLRHRFWLFADLLQWENGRWNFRRRQGDVVREDVEEMCRASRRVSVRLRAWRISSRAYWKSNDLRSCDCRWRNEVLEEIISTIRFHIISAG